MSATCLRFARGCAGCCWSRRALAAIALFLLATATANTELFAQGYDTLLVVNGGLVALLMLVVGGQLLQLRRNLRAGVFGSRLAVRLVLLFALVACCRARWCMRCRRNSSAAASKAGSTCASTARSMAASTSAAARSITC